jgi:hypothetical protein
LDTRKKWEESSYQEYQRYKASPDLYLKQIDDASENASVNTRLHFPVSGMSISVTLFFIPARIPPDSLGFLFFFRRTFGWWRGIPPNYYSGITKYSEFLFPPKAFAQNYLDFDRETGVEPRRFISWAVVDGRPRPSTSP